MGKTIYSETSINWTPLRPRQKVHCNGESLKGLYLVEKGDLGPQFMFSRGG